MKIAAKMKKIAEAQARALSINPPPITFDVSSDKKKKRNDRKGDDDDDETRYVVFEIRLDPEGNSPEKVKRKLKVFDNGTPEEYCKWRMDYDDLVENPAYSTRKRKQISYKPCLEVRLATCSVVSILTTRTLAMTMTS